VEVPLSEFPSIWSATIGYSTFSAIGIDIF